MSAKKRNIPSKTTTSNKGTGKVHKEYVNLIHKELNTLLKILKNIGKVQWGISQKDNKNTRNITKKEIDLSDNILMKMASKWRFIDAYYEAVREFEKVYEEVFIFAKQHSLPYENFSLPNGKLLVEDNDLLNWVNSLLVEHGDSQMSFEKLLKLYTKDLVKQDTVHCLRDVITPTGLRMKIEREIRHDLYRQYNRIKENFMSSGPGELKSKEIVHFPTPDGTKWPDVEITFIDKESVKITVKGKPKDYHFSVIGFKDRRKKFSTQDRAWNRLAIFALKDGKITYEFNENILKHTDYYVKPKDIESINEKLLLIFDNKISNNPIPPYDRKEKCYKIELKHIGITKNYRNHIESILKLKQKEDDEDISDDELLKQARDNSYKSSLSSDKPEDDPLYQDDDQNHTSH